MSTSIKGEKPNSAPDSDGPEISVDNNFSCACGSSKCHCGPADNEDQQPNHSEQNSASNTSINQPEERLKKLDALLKKVDLKDFEALTLFGKDNAGPKAGQTNQSKETENDKNTPETPLKSP